jgi:hypothetical protein
MPIPLFFSTLMGMAAEPAGEPKMGSGFVF